MNRKIVTVLALGFGLIILAALSLKALNPSVWSKLVGPVWMQYMYHKMRATQKEKAAVTAVDSNEYLNIIDQLEEQFDSFKPQITHEPLSSVEEFEKGQEETKELYPEVAKKMAANDLNQVMFISDSHVLVAYDYLNEKGWMVGAGLFSYKKADQDYVFSLVKVMENSFLSLNEWQQLLVENQATTYDLPNFDKRGFILGGPEFINRAFTSPPPSDLAQYYTWTEVSFNPFLDGLIEDKPDQDHSIYFGFYDDRYAFFMTSPFIRQKHKLAEHEGVMVVIDAKGESKFTAAFSSLANQQWLLSFPNNTLIDFRSYGWSPTHFQLTVRMSLEDEGQKGIVDQQMLFDTNELRTEFGESQWVLNDSGDKLQLEEMDAYEYE
jgi:hypothetical protein